ncbi:MAG TPA: pentapeptide repeat-containing protein, partial [Polyangium sp.]|nr:pentapeptide repeat-containing protein [Polyangium sp.]
ILEMSIWHEAKAPGASFKNCDLTYADFSHASIEGADFSGAKMYRTKLHRVKDGGARYPLGRAGALGDDADLAEAEVWRDKHQRIWKGDGDA